MTDGNDPMLAVLIKSVDAAGAERLSADGAIEGKDDVVMKAALGIVAFRYGLSQSDGLLHSPSKIIAELGNPLKLWARDGCVGLGDGEVLRFFCGGGPFHWINTE